MIHIDFETRSTIDLLKCGTYRYATDPTTDINCMGWALDDDFVELWEPGDDIPEALLAAINRGELIAAWNAQFERLIWNHVLTRHGFPELPIERFYCIAALSRARGFPGKLEKAARFAELPYQKDMDGHYLMLKLCKPRRIEEDGTIVWWDHRDDYIRLGVYCRQDVEVERAMMNILIPFTPEELSDYHLSEEINDRGVCVDVELARAAVEGAAQEKLTADDAMCSLTDGAVTTCNQVQRILEWVEQEWKALPSLNKSDVLDALAEEDIPPHVQDVLELRLDNAKAAVSKYAAILNHQIDGVVYGGYLYRGAGQTGRFTSLGVQRHNLQRDARTDTIPILKKHGIRGLRMVGDPVKILGQMVRPTFVAAPGRTFLIGDFAQIEARVTAWLAGEESLLKIFRVNGDPYCAFGSIAFKRKITRADTLERFISKGCVLGLGFGGSEGALARTLKKEGNLTLPLDERKQHVKTYRTTYTNIVKFWNALNQAVLKAMFAPGTIVEISVVSYLFDGEHLWCKLPSGRMMCYPFARIVQDDYGDCVEYRRGNRSPKSGVYEWPTVRLWYGIETENLAQAIAFDLLMGALRRLRGSDIRLHVHDEIVIEVDEKVAEKLLQVFLDVMKQGEDWSVGLPIHAEGQISKRYVK